MRSLLPALLLAVCATVAVPLLVTPPAGAAVLAVFPPGTDSASAIRRAGEAGGRVVRPAARGPLYIVRPDRADDADFPDRLRAAGAWLLLDPILAAGCAGPVRSGPAPASL